MGAIKVDASIGMAWKCGPKNSEESREVKIEGEESILQKSKAQSQGWRKNGITLGHPINLKSFTFLLEMTGIAITSNWQHGFPQEDEVDRYKCILLGKVQDKNMTKNSNILVFSESSQIN